VTRRLAARTAARLVPLALNAARLVPLALNAALLVPLALNAALLGPLVLAPWLLGEGYALSIATRAACLGLAAAALQFALAFGGMVSLGHAAFLGIGAYAVLMLPATDLLVTAPLAVGVAVVFAVLTGAAAGRTRGVTFIMITLAFGQMVYFAAGSLADWGGDDGMALDEPSAIAGTTLLGSRAGLHWLCVGVLAVVLLGLAALGRSPFGRALRAARDNEARVTSLGYSVARLRVTAYAVSGGCTALAGALLANQAEFVSPALLDWRVSGELLVTAILGGFLARLCRVSEAGALPGAALAAAGLLVFEEAAGVLSDHWRIGLGVAFVAAAIGASGRARA
jgi:branched-chain amino acid transport system permease protein